MKNKFIINENGINAVLLNNDKPGAEYVPSDELIEAQ